MSWQVLRKASGRPPETLRDTQTPRLRSRRSPAVWVAPLDLVVALGGHVTWEIIN